MSSEKTPLHIEQSGDAIQTVVGDHNTVIQHHAKAKAKRTGAAHNVPTGGSNTFVSREDALKGLHSQLSQGEAVAITVEPFEIGMLSEDSALSLLTLIVGEARVTDELETAKAICKWVGYLPLGLELVGQYLKQKPDVTFATLQTRLKEQSVGAQALQEASSGITAQLGVIEAFELSWQALTEANEKANTAQ